MNMAETDNLVAAGLRGELRLREPMSRHTSWRAGGAAERAYFPANLDDLVACLRSLPAGEPVEVLVRPDDILHDDASPFRAEVEQKAFRGAQFLYTLRLPGGGRVLSLVPSHHNHSIGEKIGIRMEIDHLVAFRRAGGP